MGSFPLLQAGWLSDLTDWIKEAIESVWDAFVEFMGDLVVTAIEGVLSLFVVMINALPVPDFLTAYSLDGLLSQAGGTILWLVGTFRIGECLSIIAAGWAFRLLRKLFTLGQW